jgi:leucyl-tRNA synthetase
MGRFINRLWSVFNSINDKAQEDSNLTIKMHQTIKKVTDDMATFSYNTAISAIMEYVNLIKQKENYLGIYLEALVKFGLLHHTRGSLAGC